MEPSSFSVDHKVIMQGVQYYEKRSWKRDLDGNIFRKHRCMEIRMLLSKGDEPIVSGQSNDLSRDLPPGLPDSLARDIAINQVQHSTIYLC